MTINHVIWNGIFLTTLNFFNVIAKRIVRSQRPRLDKLTINVQLTFMQTRAGLVSVFGVGIGIRYFRQYFFHVGSVFGIGISEILVENRKFLVPHLYLAPLLRITMSEVNSPLLEN